VSRGPELPPAFAQDTRAAVRRCVFGHPDAPKRVVLTPIRSFFEPLAAGLVRHGGWWPSAGRDDVLVVLVPQSGAVLDAVCCLEPGTEIVVAGLTGSLGRLPLGAIVEVEAALWYGRRFARSSRQPMRFPPAVVDHVECLAESYHRWSTSVADCVDMETALVYGAAQAQTMTATALLIVSDVLPDQPFFAVEPGAWRGHTAELVRTVAELVGLSLVS